MALPLNVIHSHFFTQVCVFFPKSPKTKSIHGGAVQSLDLFLKSQSMTENVLQTQEASGQGQSRKPFRDYGTGRGWLEHCRLFCHWDRSLVLLTGFYSQIIATVCLILAQRDIGSFSAKQTEPHLFNTSVMTRWQRDPTVQSRSTQ